MAPPWKKNWNKINEGKGSKKTQNAFIDAFRKLRDLNQARSNDEQLRKDSLPVAEEVEGLHQEADQDKGDEL